MRSLALARTVSLSRALAVALRTLAVVLLTACGGSSVVDSPTQITVRISAGDGALVDQLTHLRVSAALHEADGSWKRSVSATYYADQFAVTMQGGGASGTVNLAPDELGDVMSVNSQFVAACTCPTAPNCSYGVYQRSCSLGAGVLSGTGFETGDVPGHSHAGTGWLTSTVPVTPGATLTITALIYDSGDGTYDSLALLDAFRFYRAPAGDAQTQPQVKRAQ